MNTDFQGRVRAITWMIFVILVTIAALVAFFDNSMPWWKAPTLGIIVLFAAAAGGTPKK